MGLALVFPIAPNPILKAHFCPESFLNGSACLGLSSLTCFCRPRPHSLVFLAGSVPSCPLLDVVRLWKPSTPTSRRLSKSRILRGLTLRCTGQVSPLHLWIMTLPPDEPWGMSRALSSSSGALRLRTTHRPFPLLRSFVIVFLRNVCLKTLITLKLSSHYRAVVLNRDDFCPPEDGWWHLETYWWLGEDAVGI